MKKRKRRNPGKIYNYPDLGPLYHVTTIERLDSIITRGLIPNQERIMGGNFPETHIDNNIFLVREGGLCDWYEILEFEIRSEWPDPPQEPIVLKVINYKNCEVDPHAEVDLGDWKPNENWSYRCKTKIKPKDIKVWVNNKWVKIENLINYDDLDFSLPKWKKFEVDWDVFWSIAGDLRKNPGERYYYPDLGPLYHVTTSDKIESIKKYGLAPRDQRRRKAEYDFFKHPDYCYFLTVADGVPFWFVVMERRLTMYKKYAQLPIVLKVNDYGDCEKDERGTIDSNYPAFHCLRPIYAEDIEYWDGIEWLPLKELEKYALEDLGSIYKTNPEYLLPNKNNLQ